MTKRNLVKWLEHKQGQAVSAAREKYDEVRLKLLDTVYSELGIPELSDKIQALITEACQLWDDWRETHHHLDSVTIYDGYYNLNRQLYSFISGNDATFNTITNCELKVNTAEMDKALADYNELSANIAKNYATVNKNCPNN